MPQLVYNDTKHPYHYVLSEFHSKFFPVTIPLLTADVNVASESLAENVHEIQSINNTCLW